MVNGPSDEAIWTAFEINPRDWCGIASTLTWSQLYRDLKGLRGVRKLNSSRDARMAAESYHGCEGSW